MERDILKRYMERIMEKIKRLTRAEKKGCMGKTKHKTVLAASAHLTELIKFAKKDHSLHFYKCDFCGSYHCGNSKE